MDREAETGKQRRGEQIGVVEDQRRFEGAAIAAVDRDLLGAPVDDPVLLDPFAYVELALEVAIPALVGAAGGEDFDSDLRGEVELPVGMYPLRSSLAADLDEIRCNAIFRRKITPGARFAHQGVFVDPTRVMPPRG